MTNSNECRNLREDIAALMLGELSTAAVEPLILHINGCESCRAFRDALADQEKMLRSTFDVIARGVELVEPFAERFGDSHTLPLAKATSRFGRLIGGIRAMRRSHKILAAAAAIVLTFTGLVSWFIPGRSTAGIAFADVLEQIRIYRPYSYLSTAQDEGGTAVSYRITYLSPSRRRQDYPDGRVVVFDMSQSPIRTLTLVPEQKTAVEKTLLNVGPSKDPDMLHLVSDLASRCTTTDLGSKQVDGQLSHGFHLVNEHNDITYWAELQTLLPIRVEIVHADTGRRITMTEFDFAPNLDESLFSTTAPAGYAVQKVEQDGVNPTEEHLIEGLRAIATFLDGRFPAALASKAVHDAVFEHAKRTTPLPSEEELESLELKWARALRYRMLLERYYKAGDITYAGDGVMLGDAQSAIFWWKPRGSESYRVVYGDLSVREVTPEDLAPFMMK